MADIKISELLPAITPLNGAETLPIVQNGNTVKATTQDIASLYSIGYTPENVSNKSTDSTFATADNTNYPTQLAVKNYVQNTLSNATSSWKLTGNADTNSSTNFIGTTDAQDLVFKTNNTEYLRIPASSIDTSDIISYKRIQISAAKAQFWANSSGNGYATIGANSTDKGYFNISNGTGAAIIKGTNLTGNKTLELPNANGTLVTSVNNSTPDAAGNVTLSVSGGWGLTGNAGTSPLTNFIGTTDNQDVVLKANNFTALTLRASGANVDASTRLRVYDENTSIAYAQLDQAAGNGRMILRNSGSGAAIISSSGLTGTRTYTLPNATGTLSLVNTSAFTGTKTIGGEVYTWQNGILISVV